jgi:hypothetical protein
MKNSPSVKDYSQQRVTQSQQLEMRLTAGEETQAVAPYICFYRQQHNEARQGY